MIKKRKLTNGVTVILEPISYVQSIAMGVWFKAGAVDEVPKNSGISHLIEHMMFKGTENRTAKQIAEDVDMIGGSINAFTGKEATCYYIKTLSKSFDQGAEIIGDMINNSLFDDKELEKEKLVIVEEMKMIEDTPEDYSHDLVSEAVFRQNPLGKSIIGTRDTVKTTSRSDIINYVSDKYVSENTVISVAGNMDEDKVMESLERHFGSIKSGKTERSSVDDSHSPEYIYKHKDIEQTHITLGMRSVAMNASDYYQFNIFSHLLGGGMSSRLFQNVREDKGLAYSVYSMNSSYVSDGCFVMYAAVGSDKAGEAIDAIVQEIKKIDVDGITDDELKMAKEQLKTNYMFGLESVNSRMFITGKNYLLLGDCKTEKEIIQEIEQVKKEDIIRTAKKMDDISGYSAVIMSREKYDIKSLLELE